MTRGFEIVAFMSPRRTLLSAAASSGISHSPRCPATFVLGEPSWWWRIEASGKSAREGFSATAISRRQLRGGNEMAAQHVVISLQR